MPTIEERWNHLPIPERREIALAAGCQGRIVSADWEALHQMDKDALMEWAAQSFLIAASGITPHEMTEAEEMEAANDQDLEEIKAKDIASHSESAPEDPYVNYESARSDFLEEAVEPVVAAVVHKEKVQDYLLWIGYRSYKTIQSFIDEASTLGVSRRVSKVPNGLKLGKSKVFLAHDEGETGYAVIFGYFIPSAIEVIVYRDGENGIPDKLKGIATPVTIDTASAEPERGCGFREDIGATYLMSGELVEINNHKDYDIINPTARRFRGIKKVDGAKILRGASKKDPHVALQIPAGDRIVRTGGERWTVVEREILKSLLSRMRPWRALREMSKISGRSVEGIAYQYFKMRKEAKDKAQKAD